jgi:cell division cycle protein 20 (cofactor of APC complex)
VPSGDDRDIMSRWSGSLAKAQHAIGGCGHFTLSDDFEYFAMAETGIARGGTLLRPRRLPAASRRGSRSHSRSISSVGRGGDRRGGGGPTIETALSIWDAPGDNDDFYSTLMACSNDSSNNKVAVVLGDSVWVRSVEASSADATLQLPVGGGQLGRFPTAVTWTPTDAQAPQLAVGTSFGAVQLWDAASGACVKTLHGHYNHVVSLDCQPMTGGHVVASGGDDGPVLVHDTRLPGHAVAVRLNAHGHNKVCGLRWSPDGDRLATGANDNLVNVWDLRDGVTPQRVYDEHQAAVKALAWSPHQRHYIASGGGSADRTIRVWNTAASDADVVEQLTDAQVVALIWDNHKRALLSAHGYATPGHGNSDTANCLIRWSYPDMTVQRRFVGHSGRVLALAATSDGRKLVSLGADQTVRMWTAGATYRHVPPAARTRPRGQASLDVMAKLGHMVR